MSSHITIGSLGHFDTENELSRGVESLSNVTPVKHVESRGCIAEEGVHATWQWHPDQGIEDASVGNIFGMQIVREK